MLNGTIVYAVMQLLKALPFLFGQILLYCYLIFGILHASLESLYFIWVVFLRALSNTVSATLRRDFSKEYCKQPGDVVVYPLWSIVTASPFVFYSSINRHQTTSLMLPSVLFV